MWISYSTLQFSDPYSVITFMPPAFKVKYVFQGHYSMFDMKVDRSFLTHIFIKVKCISAAKSACAHNYPAI